MKSNSHLKIWESSPYMIMLSFFFSHPNGEFFGAEVAKKTGLSAGAVHKYLLELEKDTLLVSKSKGRMKFFSLNRNNPAARHLKIAYSLSSLVISAITKAASGIENIQVFLYGSAARGEDNEESDWDILVIGKPEGDEISSIAREASKLSYPRRVAVAKYTNQEWARTAKEDHAFYEGVEKDKIRLI